VRLSTADYAFSLLAMRQRYPGDQSGHFFFHTPRSALRTAKAQQHTFQLSSLSEQRQRRLRVSTPFDDDTTRQPMRLQGLCEHGPKKPSFKRVGADMRIGNPGWLDQTTDHKTCATHNAAQVTIVSEQFGNRLVRAMSDDLDLATSVSSVSSAPDRAWCG